MRFTSSKLYALFRLIIVLLISFTVAWQFRTLQSRQGDAFNFFSYFTILSNLFFAATMIALTASTLGGRRTTRTLEAVRGAGAVYMVATGIIYALLLSRVDVHITEPWVNHVLHQLIPVVAALDWLLAPPKKRLSHASWWSWLGFPIIYLAYSLIRGPIVNWYPYPFLDPNRPGGYVRVAGFSIGIAVFMVLLIIAVGWIGNKHAKKV